MTVDPKTGEVGVKAVKTEHVELETVAEGVGFDDVGPKENAIKKNLTESAKADLARRARKQQERLQSEATEALEGEMADVRKELNDAVNAITREALKRKAAQLGRIKEMSEDAESGSLTIKVEV